MEHVAAIIVLKGLQHLELRAAARKPLQWWRIKNYPPPLTIIIISQKLTFAGRQPTRIHVRLSKSLRLVLALFWLPSVDVFRLLNWLTAEISWARVLRLSYPIQQKSAGTLWRCLEFKVDLQTLWSWRTAPRYANALASDTCPAYTHTLLLIASPQKGSSTHFTSQHLLARSGKNSPFHLSGPVSVGTSGNF